MLEYLYVETQPFEALVFVEKYKGHRTPPPPTFT